MARHVFPTREVFHLWAHQAQGDARNRSGIVFFDGPTIYSYGHHFPMASFVQNERGERAILVTTRLYSPTTAVHLVGVRQAVHGHELPRFAVPNVENPDHGKNLDYYRGTVTHLLGKLRNARSQRPYYLGAVRDTIDQANTYAAFFGLDERIAFPAGYSAEEIDRARDQLAAEQEAVVRRREEAGLAKHQERIKRWQAGEIPTLPRLNDAVFLRVVDGNVQTSLGATIPLAHALRLLPLVRSGKTYQHTDHTFHLGPYRLDAIDGAGNIRAGCHTITRAEIERLAATLGL